MAFDWKKVKSLTRRIVHQTFGVSSLYLDANYETGQAITVRWHNKIDRFGDLENQSYAEFVQGIDRIIFDAADARALNIIRGGTVTLTDFGANTVDPDAIADPVFELDTQEPSTGPIEEVWIVTYKGVA
jgi:hypothetical protein